MDEEALSQQLEAIEQVCSACQWIINPTFIELTAPRTRARAILALVSELLDHITAIADICSNYTENNE
jgi:hypothetical protein